MPPRGFRHSHFPLFKTERWELEKFASEVAQYSLGCEVAYNELIPDTRRLVLEDIAYALRQETVKSCVVLRVARLDGSSDIDVQFLVESSFWYDEDSVVEIGRFLKREGNLVPYKYLFTANGNERRYLDEDYVCPKVERHHLQIVDPGRIFDELVDFRKLPDDKWFARYNKYRQPFSWELLAVAWRYIAVQQREKIPSISQLVDHLESYLEKEGVGMENLPKRNKLYQVARNIRDQLAREDLNSTVIVSSNPARPQIAKSNRKRVKYGLS